MLDGIELKGRCCVVCAGRSRPTASSSRSGSGTARTENTTVTAHLLADLVGRGLDVEQGVLVVLDGAKALQGRGQRGLRPGARSSAASATKSATCSSTCPNATAPAVKHRLRRAWATDDHDARPRRAARCSPTSSTASHPGAAASLREGLEETLTLTRLGIHGQLKRTLAEHEPDRVDDRDRPPHQPQRQALAERRHVPALDGRRHARSRAASSARADDAVAGSGAR